jgi:hypothetical protein
MKSSAYETGDLPILPATIRATHRYQQARITAEVILAALAPPTWFASPFFVRKLIEYLEGDPDRHLDRGWVWVYALGQFASLVVEQRKLFSFVIPSIWARP